MLEQAADSQAVATFLAAFHTQTNPSVGGCLCATPHHTRPYWWRSLRPEGSTAESLYRTAHA